MTITAEQAIAIIFAVTTFYLGVKDLRNKNARGYADQAEAWERLIKQLRDRIDELEAQQKIDAASIKQLSIDIAEVKRINVACNEELKLNKAQKNLLIDTLTVHRIPIPPIGTESHI